MQQILPTLSIIMITYGHENYIKQAIQGVFIQNTNFPIELIIANDCSPDDSDSIITETIKDAPQNIVVKYKRHDSNIGMMNNHHWALRQATGKYIAICDGDDYWIDENKLQIQVDFLEANPDYAIYCHNFKTQLNDQVSETSFFDSVAVKPEMNIVDLAHNNIVPTLTAVFRNYNTQFPDWTSLAPLGDLILFLDVARHGKIKYLDKKMAVYRQNVGVWSGKKMNHEKMIYLYENLAHDYKDIPEVEKNLIQNRNKHIKAFLKQLPIQEIFSSHYFDQLPIKDKVKLTIRKLTSWTSS
ncbi:glycosyltransferase [Chryseobacterium sp. T1]